MKKPRVSRDERRILDFINGFTKKYGAEPSYGEICRTLGFESKATIVKHIAALERRGLIKREPSQPIFCNP